MEALFVALLAVTVLLSLDAFSIAFGKDTTPTVGELGGWLHRA